MVQSHSVNIQGHEEHLYYTAIDFSLFFPFIRVFVLFWYDTLIFICIIWRATTFFTHLKIYHTHVHQIKLCLGDRFHASIYFTYGDLIAMPAVL
jgi:hypothetical protein